MFDFTITPDGGEAYELRADSRDVYVWEKTNGRGRVLADVGSRNAMADWYGIAHVAAKRQQLYTGSLDEFAKTCVIDMKESEPDPTRPDHSAAP